MKIYQLQDIQSTAHQDFDSIKEIINKTQDKVTASIDIVRFVSKKDVVTATCEMRFDGSDEIIEASIQYKYDGSKIVSDTSVDDASKEILESINDSSSEPVMAADDEGFVFEDEVETEEDFEDASNEEVSEDVVDEESEEFEDPEEGVDIDTDNNIAGHYIAECNRCHGVFISALMESDQHVEFISGVCPLCEKESDQYIKWVIKPVED